MKNTVQSFRKILPGFIAALLIAALAYGIEHILPIHLIGSSVLALLIGMMINPLLSRFDLAKGLQFSSKRILKLAIILLGASLNIEIILSVGRLSLIVMCFTLLTCFGGGYFIGKSLGLHWKLSNLISAGTGICGGSAIAAVAPVIDAEDADIAYALSATFIFDMIMIILFPLMGKWLNLNDIAYGLWAGTAVNDTSSVVAAGFAYSEAAGHFATMVKLTRTLSIIPVVVLFALLHIHLQRRQVSSQRQSNNKLRDKVKLTRLIPWFIVGFILMALINSIGWIPDTLSMGTKTVSHFLMVTALAAIGLKTRLRDMKKAGIAPMLHGFAISALVVLVSIGVQVWMGIV